MKKLPQSRWMSLWRHFYDREKTAGQLTESMIRWQETWNWSFMKVNPAACYHVLDWGAEYRFFDDGISEPQMIRPVIETPADMDRIKPLSPHQGFLGDQLQVIRNLRLRFGPDLPIVETIFGPLEIAHRLMQGREALLQFKNEVPDALHNLLKIICDTYEAFAVECLKAGADGIFYATKWATSDLLSWDAFEEFGRTYDLPILNRLQRENALVILHVCGPRNYLDRLMDDPADILSYDFLADGVPQPESVAKRTGKWVLGGVDPEKLLASPEEVLEDCRRWSRIPKWLAGPSCVVSVSTEDANIGRLKRDLWPL